MKLLDSDMATAAMGGGVLCKFLENQCMRNACFPRFLMGITLMYFLSINTVNITYLLYTLVNLF